MNAETILMKKIQLAATSCGGARLLRNHVGCIRDAEGRVHHFGLAVGSSDLIGWTSQGRFLAVEVKVPGSPGHAGGRVTPQQQAFIDAVNRAGGLGLVARSEQDLINALLQQ